MTSGSIALELPPRRALSLALAGGVVGFLGFGGWLALAIVRLTGAEGALASALLAITMPLALAISIALPPWLLRRRAPHDAKLEWDRDAIVERQGGAVRTAIAWRGARARIETSRGGRVVQITDGARAITVADPAGCPAWLARRPACSRELDRLIEVLLDRDPGPKVEPDDRDARRPTMGRQPILLTIAAGLLATPALALAIPALGPPFAALIAAILCAIPMLRPLHELAALIGESRRFDRAEDASIEDPDPSRPVVRVRGSSLLRLELDRAGHPDALLGTREDAALRIVLPPSGWVAVPTRATLGDASIAPDAIETPAERDAREALVRTVLIELGARGAATIFWGAMSVSPLWL